MRSKGNGWAPHIANDGPVKDDRSPSSILYKLHTWQNHIDGLLSFANDYTRPSRLYAVSIVSDYIAGSSVQDTAVVSEYSSRVICKLLL